MVPPTVERRVNNNLGSLQYWVEDCKLFRDVMDATPHTVEWSNQLWFDILISNDDRNAQNFLVDPDHHIIVIDHSRGFVTGKKILDNPAKLPQQFARKMAKKELTVQFDGLSADSWVAAIFQAPPSLTRNIVTMLGEICGFGWSESPERKTVRVPVETRDRSIAPIDADDQVASVVEDFGVRVARLPLVHSRLLDFHVESLIRAPLTYRSPESVSGHEIGLRRHVSDRFQSRVFLEERLDVASIVRICRRTEDGEQRC